MMKCKDMPTPAIMQRIAEYSAKPSYKPTPEGRRPVRLRFDLDPDWVGEGIFVIISQRIDKTLYVGRYTPEIVLDIGPELADASGYDNLEFRLLRTSPGIQCLWTSDPDFPFWGGALSLSIRLMLEQTFDDQGLLHGYEVRADP